MKRRRFFQLLGGAAAAAVVPVLPVPSPKPIISFVEPWAHPAAMTATEIHLLNDHAADAMRCMFDAHFKRHMQPVMDKLTEYMFQETAIPMEIEHDALDQDTARERPRPNVETTRRHLLRLQDGLRFPTMRLADARPEIRYVRQAALCPVPESGWREGLLPVSSGGTGEDPGRA